MKKFVFAALLAVSSPAFAQGFVGIGFGKASTDLEGIEPIAGISPSVDDNDSSFKIFGGGMLNPNFGIEVGYVDFGEVSATWDDGIDPVTSTGETSALYAAAVVLAPLSEQAGVFVKFGFASWDLDVTATSSAGGFATLSESGTDPMFGIGAQFTLNNLLLRAEFERFNEIEFDVIGVSAALKF